MSIENFHLYLYKIIHKELAEAFPLPDCPLGKAKAKWQREEALKLLAHKLGESNNGINVTVEINTTESE
jgi:hypothetical protein